MADAVTTIVTNNGAKNYIARFTNISDGTGESAVIKIDKSTLVNEMGFEPAKLAIAEASWSIQGFSSVRILWDHTADDTGLVLSAGNGYRSYQDKGYLNDPGTAGGTGDILFTTAGALSGATYDINLTVVKIGSL